MIIFINITVTTENNNVSRIGNQESRRGGPAILGAINNNKQGALSILDES